MKDGPNVSSHSVLVCYCSQDPRRRKNRPEIRLTEFITLAIIFLYFFATALAWAIRMFSSFVASMTVAAMGYVWLTTAIITRLPGAGPLMNRGGTVSMCVLFAVCYGMGIIISTLDWRLKTVALVAGVPVVIALFVWTMVKDQTLQTCSVCRASEIDCLHDMGKMRSRGHYLAENVFIGPMFLACQVEEDDHNFSLRTVCQPPRQKHLPVNRLTEFIISATFFVNIFGMAFAWAVWTGSEAASMSVVAMGGVWIATAINIRLPNAGLVMNNSGTVALCTGFVVCYGLGIETSTLDWRLKAAGLIGGVPLVIALFVWTVGVGRMTGYYLADNVYIRPIFLFLACPIEDDQDEYGLPVSSSDGELRWFDSPGTTPTFTSTSETQRSNTLTSTIYDSSEYDTSALY